MTAKLLPIVEAAANAAEIQYTVLDCDPDYADTAAFCEKYGFKAEQSANTILVASRKVDPTKYVACVVLATTKLDVNKTVCKLLAVKKASFADSETTIMQTNMMIGGITAVGISGLPIYIDAAVIEQTEIVMGGGNRTSKLVLSPRELRKLSNAQVINDLALPRD